MHFRPFPAKLRQQLLQNLTHGKNKFAPARTSDLPNVIAL